LKKNSHTMKELNAAEVHKFLMLIRDPGSYDKLKEMSKEYNILDLAEFSFERVAHAAPEDPSESNKHFQLFEREIYSVQNMNPF